MFCNWVLSEKKQAKDYIVRAYKAGVGPITFAVIFLVGNTIDFIISL